jgi:predicted acetyltransferase
VSYLVGEQADCLLRGTATQWLEAASEDFAGFVAARRGVQVRWACATHNEPSRRVILANGGVPDGQRRGEDRFWIDLGRG